MEKVLQLNYELQEKTVLNEIPIDSKSKDDLETKIKIKLFKTKEKSDIIFYGFLGFLNEEQRNFFLQNFLYGSFKKKIKNFGSKLKDSQVNRK